MIADGGQLFAARVGAGAEEEIAALPFLMMTAALLMMMTMLMLALKRVIDDGRESVCDGGEGMRRWMRELSAAAVRSAGPAFEWSSSHRLLHSAPSSPLQSPLNFVTGRTGLQASESKTQIHWNHTHSLTHTAEIYMHSLFIIIPDTDLH